MGHRYLQEQREGMGVGQMDLGSDSDSGHQPREPGSTQQVRQNRAQFCVCGVSSHPPSNPEA